MRKLFSLLLLLLFFSGRLFSQTLLSGTFTFPGTQSATIYPFVYNGTAITNLTVSNLSTSGALTWSGSGGNARAVNYPTGATTGVNTFTGAISTTDYFEFTLSASSGYYIHNPGIAFGVGRSSTGPRQFEWRSSIDNFQSSIPIGTSNVSLLSNTSGVLTTPDANSGYTGNSFTISQMGLTSITFRFYGYNSESPTGTGGIQGPLTFSMYISASPLPVSFSSINATNIGKNNKVTWSTASEEHNRGFDIQRSTDGVNYTFLGFVNSLSSTGNSSSTLNYSFIDYDPIGLKQYYRLKQTDFDGTSRYSGVVVVTTAAPERLAVTSIYPNPASSFVHLSVASPSREAMQLIVTDANGRSVRNKYVNAEIGNNSFEVDLTGLGAGIYYLSLKGPLTGWKSIGKFVKN